MVYLNIKKIMDGTMISLPRIKKLPDYLINRIAAGEVVDRPASALKELLENSIDAKSTKILVELLDGGIKQIKVIDNGIGICHEDIKLALDRHATSKIILEDDLYEIKTLGFRGEGLASISSVSRSILSSRIKDADYGYTISSNFGEISDVMPMAMNNGTIIEVNDLYHNIPARKKFLKSSTTEYGHCKSVFERISLSYPEINFELKHNGKLVYQNSSEALLARIEGIFGDDYSKHYFDILETSIDGLNMSGYVYHPSYLQGSKVIQYFYLNGRFIRDRVIQNAIKQGFSGVLHHDHQPQYVLFMEISSQEVDVNVHPSKSEVRFRNASLAHSFISKSLRKALASSLHDMEIKKNKPIEIIDNNTDNNISVGVDLDNKNINYLDNQEINEIKSNYMNNGFATASNYTKFNDKTSFRNISNQKNNYTKPVFSGGKDHDHSSLNYYNSPKRRDRDQISSTENHLFTDLVVAADHEFYNSTSDNSNNGNTRSQSDIMPPLGFAIAQLNGVYILSQVQDGLIVVDMHAAHERIVLEKLKDQYMNSSSISAQNLLLPTKIKISEILLEALEQNKDELLKLGFRLEVISENEILISTTPVLLNCNNVEKLVVDVLAEISNYGNSSLIFEHQEELLSTMACHSAFRANHSLNNVEMNALLREMEKIKRANYCNHGRPTWFKLTMQELDAMFMRGK